MTEQVCNVCGSDVIYERVDTSTYEQNSTQDIPVRCTNPACQYSRSIDAEFQPIFRAAWDAAHSR